MNSSLSSLATSLYEIGAIRFGSYTLKSGIVSPIYVDLRLLVSYPTLLKQVADLLWDRILPLPINRICGVPYTALPIATALSLLYKIPMVMRRREVKAYGTRKRIEGVFSRGEECLVVEDLITSGGSLLETVADLEAEGLHVAHAVVVLDRQQGGKEILAAKGITVHALLTIHELLGFLEQKGAIASATKEEVMEFLATHQVEGKPC